MKQSIDEWHAIFTVSGMKIINTRLHGILDYTVALLLIPAPWLLGFNEILPATLVLIIQGIFLILYSLFTDYEYGLIRVLNMRVHLTLDIALAALTIASPWIFSFVDKLYLPHVIIGAMELVIILLSQNSPKDREIPQKLSRPFPFRAARVQKELH